MDQGKRQLPALTGMRFFLALWVVIYHQIPPVDELLASWPWLLRGVESMLRTGYAAVGVFFVLSGFVLAYNYDLSKIVNRANMARFGVARFARIYPAYLIGLLLLVPLSVYRYAVGLPDTPIPESVTFLLNVSLLQAWVPAAALSWNYPGWSLSNEAFFYLCFPVIGWALWRVKRTGGLIAAAAVFWILSLAVPVAAVMAPIAHFGDVAATDLHLAGAGEAANVIRYNPLIRLPEFCFGIVLAQIYRRIPWGHWLRGRGSWLYLPAIVGCIAVLASADHIPYPLMHNGLLLPLYACIILGFALEGGGLAGFLSTVPLVFLGNASYTMYILHYPVDAWLAITFHRVFLVEPLGWVWFLTYIGVVVVGTALFYRFIEEPLHRWVRRRLMSLVTYESHATP